MSLSEYKNALRHLELNAYGSVVSALRAQGDLNPEKRRLLKDLQTSLKITTERHRAEVRRAISDDRLEAIADCISEESETNSQWQTEGRRLVPTLRRHISHTSHASSARNLLRPERPANLRSAAAATAAAPVVVTQETRVLETRSVSNSLGKRRKFANAVVPSKHSALPNDHRPPVVNEEPLHVAVTSASSPPRPAVVESPACSEVPSYNQDVIPLHVASESSPPESPQMELPESSQCDEVVDMSMASHVVPTPVPPASHIFQLIHPPSAQNTLVGFSSPHAVETSVHPLLSMVQQVIPPLHSPPLPSSQVAYPFHVSPQPSHQALQPSHHALQPSYPALQPSYPALQLSHLAVDLPVNPVSSSVQPSHQALQPFHQGLQPSHQALQLSHQALQPSLQALQLSHHAVDQPVHPVSSSVQQTSVPLLLMRTSSSSGRGASSRGKSTPTPKVIIVSGTGVTSATTIAGPPPTVTTSVVTKPAPAPANTVTSAPASLSAEAARAATPHSVRHLFGQRRSMPIIRPRLGAITARLHNPQTTSAASSTPTVSVSVSLSTSSSSTSQKLPTCIPLSTSHTVTSSGSSVHLPSSNLSIQLKPIAPHSPVIQIRQDADVAKTVTQQPGSVVTVSKTSELPTQSSSLSSSAVPPAVPPNVVRSLGVPGKSNDTSMMSAGSNDLVSAGSDVSASTLIGSLSSSSSRVVTVDNIVRVTSTISGTSTSGGGRIILSDGGGIRRNVIIVQKPTATVAVTTTTVTPVSSVTRATDDIPVVSTTLSPPKVSSAFEQEPVSFIAKHDEKQLQRVADTMSTAAENASSRTSLGHSLHEAALSLMSMSRPMLVTLEEQSVFTAVTSTESVANTRTINTETELLPCRDAEMVKETVRDFSKSTAVDSYKAVPSDRVLQEQAKPIDLVMQRKIIPAEAGLQHEAVASDDVEVTAVHKAAPTDGNLQQNAVPMDVTVQQKADPKSIDADGELQDKATPTDTVLQHQAAPTHATLQHDGVLNEKAVPTSDKLRLKAAPAGAVLQDKAPPNDSVLKHNTASSDNAHLQSKVLNCESNKGRGCIEECNTHTGIVASDTRTSDIERMDSAGEYDEVSLQETGADSTDSETRTRPELAAGDNADTVDDSTLDSQTDDSAVSSPAACQEAGQTLHRVKESDAADVVGESEGFNMQSYQHVAQELIEEHTSTDTGAEAEKALDSCNNESASPRDFTHNSIDRLAACESDMSFTCFSTRDGHDADGCVETTSLLRQSSTEGSTVDRTELNKSSTAQNCAVTGLSNDHGNGTDYDELAAGDSDLVIAKTQESGSAEPDSICLAECNSDAKHVAAVTDTNSADVVTDSNGPNLIDLTKNEDVIKAGPLMVNSLNSVKNEISVHRGPESPYVGLGRRKRKPPTSFVYDDKVGLATPSWIRVARTLLSRVMKLRSHNGDKNRRNPAAWFNQPVDEHEVPDYYDIVKKPMDFGKIKKKLETKEYFSWSEFHSDMLLVRENCHLYNAAGTQVRRDCDVVFNFYLDESAKLGDSLSQGPTLTGKRLLLPP